MKQAAANALPDINESDIEVSEIDSDSDAASETNDDPFSSDDDNVDDANGGMPSGHQTHISWTSILSRKILDPTTTCHRGVREINFFCFFFFLDGDRF